MACGMGGMAYMVWHKWYCVSLTYGLGRPDQLSSALLLASDPATWQPGNRQPADPECMTNGMPYRPKKKLEKRLKIVWKYQGNPYICVIINLKTLPMIEDCIPILQACLAAVVVGLCIHVIVSQTFKTCKK